MSYAFASESTPKVPPEAQRGGGCGWRYEGCDAFEVAVRPSHPSRCPLPIAPWAWEECLDCVSSAGPSIPANVMGTPTSIAGVCTNWLKSRASSSGVSHPSIGNGVSSGNIRPSSAAYAFQLRTTDLPAEQRHFPGHSRLTILSFHLTQLAEYTTVYLPRRGILLSQAGSLQCGAKSLHTTSA